MAHFPLGKQQVSRRACPCVRRAYRFMKMLSPSKQGAKLWESAARKYRKSEAVGLSHEHRYVEGQLPEEHRFAMITTLSTDSIFWVARQ
jgi:hypothetical protein